MLERTTNASHDIAATPAMAGGLIGPALEEISDELAGKVVIAKLNIDDHPDAPGKYGVRGIPTMILFKNGQPADPTDGAEPKSQLKAWLQGEL